MFKARSGFDPTLRWILKTVVRFKSLKMVRAGPPFDEWPFSQCHVNTVDGWSLGQDIFLERSKLGTFGGDFEELRRGFSFTEKNTDLGVASPCFSTIVLFNHRLFPLGF